MTLAPPVLRDAVSLRCDVAQPWEAHADVLVVVLPCGGSDVPAWLAPHAAAVRALAQGARLMIHRPADAAFQAGVVEVVALGAPTRAAARTAGREIGAVHRDARRVAVTGLDADGPDSTAQAFVAGFAEARYRFTRYLSAATPADVEVTLVGVGPDAVGRVRRDLAAAEIVEGAVRWSRDLTNTPARDLTPEEFAAEAVREGRAAGAEVTVRDVAWLESEGFAGLVAVGAGSPHPPCLVEVTYRGADAADVPPLVLVGKGVTFDSGGLSLKKAAAMMEMKSDMAGAATTLAAVCAVARLAPPRAHVVALLALAENMPGPAALRPGDILRHRNRRTTEVVNTDCEGRLVMSDVLAWATERAPAAMIDVATLTYSTISALGMEITSVIGNDPELVADVRAAGDATGDPYWELPLWEPYRRLIESPFADLRNEESSEDAPGAITAALYLSEFVGRVPWAHLDTGGTAYLDEETDHLAAGATGTGVRSLVRLVLDRQNPHRGGTS